MNVLAQACRSSPISSRTPMTHTPELSKPIISTRSISRSFLNVSSALLLYMPLPVTFLFHFQIILLSDEKGHPNHVYEVEKAAARR
jgi:hypothetical protein